MNLNGAHLHLLINHAPVFWLPVAALLLGASLLRGNQTLARAGLYALVVVAVVSVLVMLTGDPASHALRGSADISRALIHDHAQLASLATYLTGGAGLLALALLWRFRGRDLARWACAAALALTLVAFGLMAVASQRGGAIRHPEVRDGWAPAAAHS